MDAGRSLGALVEEEVQRGRVAQADLLAKLVAERTTLLLQASDRALFLLVAAKDGNKDLGGGEVRRHLDAADGDKAGEGIAHAADQALTEDLLDFFGDAGGSNGHGEVKAGEV